MASMIHCPHCGLRPREEFSIRGATAGPRPTGTAEPAGSEWMDYVYLRENPRGLVRENWYHASGCGRWLTVTRHAVTHAVLSAEDIQMSGSGAGS